MDLLDINDHFPVGTILKPHGLKGDVILEIAEGYDDFLADSDYLLVEAEGGLVPFFVSEGGINFRTPTTLSLAFDDLDTIEKVRPYCGCKIYLHKDVDKAEEDEGAMDELIGVAVFDQQQGKLGRITRTDNFSGNVVITVDYKGKEVLIPFSEDIILQFDEEKKELHLDCPEGLIELYLE